MKMSRLLLGAAIVAVLATPAFAAGNNRATASANANASARSSSIGVGNNFGNQSLRNTNANTLTNSLGNTNTFSPTNNIGGQHNSQTASQSTTVNNIDPATGNGNGNGNSWGHQQAPAIFAPSAPSASGSCATALTFGASGPGAGLSFSLPWNDHRCDVRANSILLANVLHVRKAAIQNACHDTEMAQALGASGIACRVGPTVKQQ
jgi:hypothetical protein